MFSRYKSVYLVVVGTTFHTEGGDWRSIYLYAKQAQNNGKKVILINPRDKRGFRQTLVTALVAPRVLVNGLNSFDSWLVLAMCLARSDVRIYLHETEYALDGYKTAHSLRYSLLRHVFARNPLLCVSDKAAAFYRKRFGSTKTHVVYECPGHENVAPLESGRIHIVNVGSLNERKGVELFSKVADLAQERHPEWQFHWIGGLATMNSLYRSPAVKWHGFMWRPHDLVKQCRLLFLSSVDDPCPLSALEALQAGVGCVAYSKTGTAEIIDGTKGCAVFSEYMPESAIAALEKAMAVMPHDPDLIRKAASQSSLAAFSRAIESV